MGLLDIFKRDSGGATPAGATANVISGEQAEQARVQARRRLIGAVVLLGVGVIAFPILFETQPRPIPVDIPIVIPPRDGAPPLVLPAPRVAATSASATTIVAPASAAVATAAASPGKPIESPAATPAPAKASDATPAKPVPPPQPAPDAPKPAVASVKPAPAPAPKVVTEAAKPALAEAAKPSAGGRFVVQIGAFVDAGAVRDARSKAGKAGLTTFTQVVDTAGGPRTRVRIGPFATREDADKAAAQARAAGVPGVVLTL
jgi:DedD protein